MIPLNSFTGNDVGKLLTNFFSTGVDWSLKMKLHHKVVLFLLLFGGLLFVLLVWQQALELNGLWVGLVSLYLLFRVS
jgi:hypothetical protein